MIEFQQMGTGIFWTTVAFLGLVVVLAVAYVIKNRE